MKKLMHIVFDLILSNVVKILGILLLGVVGLQVASRIFMKVPISWTEEVTRFIFIWYCFLGSAITLIEKQHLGIDYIYRKFNIKGRRIADIGIQILTLIFGAIIAYYGWKLSAITGNRLSAIMRIPLTYVYSVVPIMGVLFCLIAIDTLIDLFKNEVIIKNQ